MKRKYKTQHFTSLANSVYKSVKVFRTSPAWAMYFGRNGKVNVFTKIESTYNMISIFAKTFTPPVTAKIHYPRGTCAKYCDRLENRICEAGKVLRFTYFSYIFFSYP